MFDKKIKFCPISKEMGKVWPHPKPASHFIPEEYKKLERHKHSNLQSPTIKTCMPFLDVMSAGYIIPFDQDYIINPTEKEFSVAPANKEKNDIGFHDKVQLPKEWHNKTGEYAGKFINKWLVITPPGYSCLFTPPINRFGEDRFLFISGMVDTDTYINTINFPFILLKRDKQFLIKKGDPMIQVIPFKRESWKMSTDFYKEKRHESTVNLINSKWIDSYKQQFWHKKSFK
jgi:hypothetical protein|tara:strand:+ start:139 stop:828 length:690 start_codon:yes stop_codon:yes gene_type:complete